MRSSSFLPAFTQTFSAAASFSSMILPRRAIFAHETRFARKEPNKKDSTLALHTFQAGSNSFDANPLRVHSN
jgi:hypothetical protein